MSEKLKLKKITITAPCIVRDLQGAGIWLGGSKDKCLKDVGDIMELLEPDADELIGGGDAQEYTGPLGHGENIWVRKRKPRPTNYGDESLLKAQDL